MANDNLLPNNPTLTDIKNFIKNSEDIEISISTEEKILNFSSLNSRLNSNLNTIINSLTTIKFDNYFLSLEDKQARSYIESLTTQMPTYYDVRNTPNYSSDKQYARQENQWVPIEQQSTETIATIGDNVEVNEPLKQLQITSGDYAVKNIISSEFNEAVEYNINDITLYNHKLYIFINHHQGAWNNSDVEEISNIANFISKKANKIIYLEGIIGPDQGTINNNKISSNMHVINYRFSPSENIISNLNWSTTTGSISFSTEALSDSTIAYLYLSEILEVI